jgi:putative 10TM heavy-metal exporter
MHFLHELIPITKQSLTITLFVLSMMLIIEYLNVYSKGIWGNNLKTSTWKQIILAALLGIIPGCLGAYTAVSLYIHNVIGTAALATAMIATSGDEAFFMFSIIPETAVLIHIAIFIIAIATGFIVSIFVKKNMGIVNYPDKHLEVHSDEAQCFCFNRKDIIANFRNITNLRLILILILIGALAIITFFNGHEHGDHIELISMPMVDHEHPEWIRITFIAVIVISLLMIITVNNHFLSHHIWGHVIKKHFIRIIAWTFATLLVLNIVNHYIDLEQLVGENLYLVLLVAVLVGIIPESGPHLFFVILFASGALPLSILLANSIVQDGHGSLPLLAESRKGFVIIKAINLIVGLIVGVIGLSFGM